MPVSALTAVKATRFVSQTPCAPDGCAGTDNTPAIRETTFTVLASTAAPSSPGTLHLEELGVKERALLSVRDTVLTPFQSPLRTFTSFLLRRWFHFWEWRQ